MNRIHNPAQSVEASLSSARFEPEASPFAPPAHDTSHSLFVPLHYEPGYAYPLIVWMHGPGTMGQRELLDIMPTVSVRNYVAVAPRGLCCDRQHAGNDGGFAGSPGLLDWPQREQHIEQAECRVFHAVQAACRRCHVARERIFLAGFGSGGTMAFRVAMNHPERFRGVLSLCGGFPRGHHPLAQLPLARRLALFLAMGRDSLEYPPAQACDDLRLFHSAGMSVALRQYPCGQELSRPMLRDVDRWLIEQVTSANGAPPPADDPWHC